MICAKSDFDLKNHHLETATMTLVTNSTSAYLREHADIETEGSRSATAVAESITPARFYVGNCMGAGVIVDRAAQYSGNFFGVRSVAINHRRDYSTADAQAIVDWLNGRQS